MRMARKLVVVFVCCGWVRIVGTRKAIFLEMHDELAVFILIFMNYGFPDFPRFVDLFIFLNFVYILRDLGRN